MLDPVKIMADNNLTGIFNLELHQSGRDAIGIQDVVDSIFTLEERQNRFLDTPKHEFFDNMGRWRHKGQSHRPGIYGYFFGGRLDFFCTDQYKKFAQRVAPYTYTYWTNEQSMISVAWALLATMTKCGICPSAASTWAFITMVGLITTKLR